MLKETICNAVEDPQSARTLRSRRNLQNIQKTFIRQIMMQKIIFFLIVWNIIEDTKVDMNSWLQNTVEC